MTIVRVGSTSKYAEGWAKAFGGKSGGSASAAKKAAAPKKKAAAPKKKAAKPKKAKK